MNVPPTGVVNAQTWAMLGAKFEMLNHVNLFGQPSNMTCWSACTTMLKGPVSAGNAAAELSPKGGLYPDRDNLESFASSWGLRCFYDLQPSFSAFSDFLSWTPIILGVRWPTPGAHVVVVAGMWSDGSDAGTTMLIYDPWPQGDGKVYTSPMLNARLTGSSVASYIGILTR